MAVIPTASSLFVCDYHIAERRGKVDLYGLFNGIRAPRGFPHSSSRFCLFAQLLNGLGTVSVRFDIRHAENEELVRRTDEPSITFPNRTTMIQVAMTVTRTTFPYPGVYFIELFCNNTWVCDTRLLLYE